VRRRPLHNRCPLLQRGVRRLETLFQLGSITKEQKPSCWLTLSGSPSNLMLLRRTEWWIWSRVAAAFHIGYQEGLFHHSDFYLASRRTVCLFFAASWVNLSMCLTKESIYSRNIANMPINMAFCPGSSVGQSNGFLNLKSLTQKPQQKRAKAWFYWFNSTSTCWQ